MPTVNYKISELKFVWKLYITLQILVTGIYILQQNAWCVKLTLLPSTVSDTVFKFKVRFM